MIFYSESMSQVARLDSAIQSSGDDEIVISSLERTEYLQDKHFILKE